MSTSIDGPRDRTLLVATIERPSGSTGVHTHIAEFLRWTQARGLRARLVTPFHAARAQIYPLFGVGRAMKTLSPPFWVWWYRWTHALIVKQQLATHLTGGRSAVVYAQDPLSATAAIELRDAGAPIDVVLFVHFNGSHAEELAIKGQIARGGRLYRAIQRHERQALARVDRVIFPSRYAARATGVPLDDDGAPRRAWLVPNFVARRTPPSASAAHGGDLITIGTLEPRKNQAFILEVLAEAHRRGRSYTLTVVGSGPLASQLRAMATRLRLERLVTFAGARADAAALIAGHRLYVHAATIENCPMVLLEAMAAGVPPIAPRVGGIPELFEPGIHGLFWNLDDVRASADRLIDLLEDEPRRSRMAAAARDRHARAFSPEARCPLLLDLLLAPATIAPPERPLAHTS